MEETERLASLFVDYLGTFDVSSSVPNVFGFSGDLGSGKTSFTKCVAKLLGIDDHISSPTFVIQKIYPLDPARVPAGFPFKKLVHIDAYRLESAEEIRAIGWDYLIADRTNLILVEWSERIIEALPPETPIIRFSFVSEHVRTIEFPDMMGIL